MGDASTSANINRPDNKVPKIYLKELDLYLCSKFDKTNLLIVVYKFYLGRGTRLVYKSHWLSEKNLNHYFNKNDTKYFI